MAYHFNKINKGTLGEFSKIREEFEELEDALKQECKIMATVELSDLYGAIEEYAKNKYNLSMSDLKKMSDITKSSFKDGTRK